MPQPVAELKLPQPVVLVPDLAIRGQVGDIGDFFAHPQRLPGHDRGHAALERTEDLREVEMLLSREGLGGEDQHAVLGEGGANRLFIGGRERLGQVDIANLGGKAGRHGRQGDRHGVSCIRVWRRLRSRAIAASLSRNPYLVIRLCLAQAGHASRNID